MITSVIRHVHFALTALCHTDPHLCHGQQSVATQSAHKCLTIWTLGLNRALGRYGWPGVSAAWLLFSLG